MVPTIKILLVLTSFAVTLAGCSDSNDATRPPTPETNADSSSARDTDSERSVSALEAQSAKDGIATSTDSESPQQARGKATPETTAGTLAPEANRDRPKHPGRSWEAFKAARTGCDGQASTDRERCLARVTEEYRGTHFDCEALRQPDRELCADYTGERGRTAAAQLSNKAVTHDKDPATIPATPDDPRPAERNRDSTKQHQDAVGAMPQAPVRDN